MAKKLVDMKREPVASEGAYPGPSPSSDYPYGLCLCLCQEELEKLGLSKGLKAGEYLGGEFIAKVTSSHTNQIEGQPVQNRIEIVMAYLSAEKAEMEDETEETPKKEQPRHKRLYR